MSNRTLLLLIVVIIIANVAIVAIKAADEKSDTRCVSSHVEVLVEQPDGSAAWWPTEAKCEGK